MLGAVLKGSAALSGREAAIPQVDERVREQEKGNAALQRGLLTCVNAAKYDVSRLGLMLSRVQDVKEHANSVHW